MKTLTKIIMGTAFALGLGCSRDYRSGKSIESIALPESCAEVVSIERSNLHNDGHYNYDLSCKETDGKYRLHRCDYVGPKRGGYSCRPDVVFEPTGKR